MGEKAPGLTLYWAQGPEPAAARLAPWEQFDFSCLSRGPLYFYVGAGLSATTGVVGWNEMACLIWWYLKHYERAQNLGSCPVDDPQANVALLKAFVNETDRSGKPILSMESEDPRALGRTVLLNMMLRYRAPRVRFAAVEGEAKPVKGSRLRARPGVPPSAEDLVLQSLVWRNGCNGVFTSNYDILLEHAYSLFNYGAALRTYRYNADHIRYLLSNPRFVLKLHGDINDLRTMELDPDGAWESGGCLGGLCGRNLRKAYQAALARGHMIYVGCGFRDRTIQELHGAWLNEPRGQRNRRVALVPAGELPGISAAFFEHIEFLTYSAGFHEVKDFLERVVAARGAEHGAWKPSPEASDLHEQIFLSWNDSPPVQRLQTELWTCRGIRPTAQPEET